MYRMDWGNNAMGYNIEFVTFGTKTQNTWKDRPNKLSGSANYYDFELKLKIKEDLILWCYFFDWQIFTHE